MVMQTMQIRLTKELINELTMLVEWGLYGSVSEAVRDGVRRLVTGKEKDLTKPAVKQEIKEEVKKVEKKPRKTNSERTPKS